jgi:hypothetical protein
VETNRDTTTDHTQHELDQHEQQMVINDNGVEHQNPQDELPDEAVECTSTRAAN